MIFLDTNILLYAFGTAPEEASKRETALALLENQNIGFSAQVLAEFYHNGTRKIRIGMSKETAREIVEELAAYRIIPVDADVVLRGVAIAQRYKISYWDGAIIAAAERMECATVYSEDLNAGQAYGSVTVVDPFKEAA